APASSLPHVPDPESDLARAASPTITRLPATVVTNPGLESTAAFALVTELVDFAAMSRLDYVASLVTESDSVCPPSIEGEPALSNPDALDIPSLCSYAEVFAGEYSSQWQTAMEKEMASWKSTGTYVDEVPPLGANIVDGMWIFRVKRPPGSPPTFKARYVARGFTRAMAAQDLRWLTYLLTDLGERPHSPPILYIDNKAILALFHEQGLEHRTKPIALRYFLARKLQQGRHLRLSYVASRANTANVFTKALGSGDHQRFCTALGLVPTLPHLLLA
ncbi:unnamed protein product, partial [Closterium sp. NIES-54]